MRALLTLGLIGAIGYSSNWTTDPTETAFVPPEQAEVHAVVVDKPPGVALPQGSGEIWDLLESSGQLVEPIPTTRRIELNAIELPKISSATTYGVDPFPPRK